MTAGCDFFLADDAATAALGAQLAPCLSPGMVIFLQGELGAGKTALTRAILQARGHLGKVKSPSYTLVEPYVISNIYFYHFDLYRFDDPSEWEAAGFREYLNSESVVLIEWPEKAEGLLPTPDWTIHLQYQGEGRHISIQSHTTRGQTCLKPLTHC